MRSKIQQIFDFGWNDYSSSFSPSTTQQKAAYSISACKSGSLGCNISQCEDCGHVEIHNNSCRNRNYPNCQAIFKEVWIDARKSEVIDAPYFHVVFTVPSELNPLIYANQELLYALLHRCSSETLLELSSDKKYLGATPGIIQVLPSSCEGLRNSYAWAQYRDGLYKKEWCPYMFQKIRYYGFLNNRNKKKNLSIIFRIQGHQKFTSKFTGVAVPEIMKSVWNYDISICPCCGKRSMRHAGRTFALLN